MSEREHAEAALRDCELRYRMLVNCSLDALLIFRNEQVAFANPAAVSLFGASSRNALAGIALPALFHPDDRALIGEQIALLQAKGIIPYLEGRIVRVGGEIRDVELHRRVVR